MLSFNQLHACPLQEENILLHSCNLQGLLHPEPRMAYHSCSLMVCFKAEIGHCALY